MRSVSVPSRASSAGFAFQILRPFHSFEGTLKNRKSIERDLRYKGQTTATSKNGSCATKQNPTIGYFCRGGAGSARFVVQILRLLHFMRNRTCRKQALPHKA
jgi:hypothetical protein